MKIKCSVCGKRFLPKKEDVYQTVESLSLTQALTSTPKTYDVIDCPKCGCQELLGIRMPKAAERIIEDEVESEA